MNILLVCDCNLPVSAYDDKARMVWWLGKALFQLGHHVTLMLKDTVVCDFATTLVQNKQKSLNEQIPAHIDLIHFHCDPKTEPDRPYLITYHEVSSGARSFDPNTVFLSDRHAHMHHGSVFVYPGADFESYTPPDLGAKRIWYHFLGDAGKKGRNVRGAIDLTDKAGGRLHVVGGTRVNFRQGFRIPLSTTARFHGALSPDGRDMIVNASKGLVLPVLWPEPFSLAVVESLFYGCPVFGTPFGALPEQLGKKPGGKSSQFPTSGTVEAFYSDYGCLSVKKTELVEAIRNVDEYEREKCHEYALSRFSSKRMAEEYLALYEKVLKGGVLHENPPAVEEGMSDKMWVMS
ncbi:MAG: hypothetical protein JNJ57_10380 [Saprospiraceae bacterium]|nr:hypothetical protein [Saprospiraceae bacterium]